MPGIDIVVSDETASKIIAIQVKVKQDLSQKKGWTLNIKDENRSSDNLFYVFVDLAVKKKRETNFYVFTSHEVARRIKKFNKKWLKDPKHNANRIRSFYLKDGERPNNWEILNI